MTSAAPASTFRLGLPEPDDDLAAFDIDKATGQITVAQKLDFESRGTPDDGKYVVVATVTDPSADLDRRSHYRVRLRVWSSRPKTETKTRCCRDGRS